MRPRISVSNGSFQLSKRWPSVSFCGSKESAFVVALVMAWSPVRRVNAGRFEVKHPGDYATFNSNHSRETTSVRKLLQSHSHLVLRSPPKSVLPTWMGVSRDGAALPPSMV